MNIAELILTKNKKDTSKDILAKKIEEASSWQEWEKIMDEYYGTGLLTDSQEKVIKGYIENSKWLDQRNKQINKRYKLIIFFTITTGIVATICLAIIK